jgi:pyrimidine-nucleoside phosphorylase
MSFLPSELIKKKRNRQALTAGEISFFINGYTKGEIPDYQMSALLMAIYLNSMNNEETLALTQTMLHSGVVVDLSKTQGFKVDKHSTGGVGDKTSLILGPIVAAAGLKVPMISGRGLGHTGGTLDKLESIPGFNTQLSLPQFEAAVEKHGICFIGQTKEICPADKKIYALRDVTATIESLPLICASIMSKKLAEGIDGLVLDVKFGSGAFMKTPAQAEELALSLMAIAKGAGKKVASVLSDMNQPLGRYAGNSLEVAECVAIMKGESIAPDTRELSLRLSSLMIWLGGGAKNEAEAYDVAEKVLTSGQAYEKFEELCHLHGGNLSALPRAKNKLVVAAKSSGYVSAMKTEGIGIVGIKIRAGRAQVSDVIEPTAGIEFHKKIGEKIQAGEPLFTLYGADANLLQDVQDELLATTDISLQKPTPPTLILKTLL